MRTNKNCSVCGCGLHPTTGECSYCKAKETVELELNVKLPDDVLCPYCEGTGKYPEWYNDITQEIVNENCDFCQGTRWCNRELAGQFKQEDETKELPF